MSLGLPNTGSAGDIMPRIQYDARAGRFFLVERNQDHTGQWVSIVTEMPMPLRLTMDLATVEIGWIRLQSGVDFRMVQVGEPFPECPGDHYKSGFRVHVYRKDIGLRSFSSTAKAVTTWFDTLHTAWQAAAAQHPGQWPVVEITGTAPVTTGGGQQSSTNYAPVGTITQWIAAPAKPNGADQPAPAVTAPATAPPVDDGFGPAPTAKVYAPAPDIDQEF